MQVAQLSIEPKEEERRIASTAHQQNITGEKIKESCIALIKRMGNIDREQRQQGLKWTCKHSEDRRGRGSLRFAGRIKSILIVNIQIALNE
jgi:hypothetical protein